MWLLKVEIIPGLLFFKVLYPVSRDTGGLASLLKTLKHVFCHWFLVRLWISPSSVMHMCFGSARVQG